MSREGGGRGSTEGPSVLSCALPSFPPPALSPDTWYLVFLFGWTAPLACFLYFAVGALVNASLFRPLVALVFQQVGGREGGRAGGREGGEANALWGLERGVGAAHALGKEARPRHGEERHGSRPPKSVGVPWGPREEQIAPACKG